MKLQKKYGYGYNYFTSAAHIPGKQLIEAHNFLENLTIIPNGDLILRHLLKLLISWDTQKLIFWLPD